MPQNDADLASAPERRTPRARPAADSKLHAIEYRKPADYRRPSVIVDAQAVVEFAKLGRGALGRHFGRLSVRGRARQRALRRDARVNRCTLLMGILAHTDIATGMVVADAPVELPDVVAAGPGAKPARFLQPMSAAKIVDVAYGGAVLGEVSVARVQRGLRDLEELGLVELQEQAERLSNGDMLNMPSIKCLTDAFWKLCRLDRALRHARKGKTAEKEIRRMRAIIASVARRRARRRAELSVEAERRRRIDPAKLAAAEADYRRRAAGLLRGEALEKSVRHYLKKTFGF